jgi:transcriptional antiterminator RfaH
MFPGYLFSKFVYREVYRRVSSAAAVQCIVRFGDYVPTLNNDAITVLRERAGEDELITVDPEIRVGDSVRVSEGPLQGLLGLVTTVVPARERVRVLLDFLGRQIEAEVKATKVIPVDGRLRI